MKYLIVTLVAAMTFQARAESAYNGVIPKSGENAEKNCASVGGQYLGNFAMIKTDNGELHSSGPSQEEVSKNFEALSQYLAALGSQVDSKYGSAENWEWLELRFACYQNDQDSISFVLRARSTGGLLRSYELTYLYSGSEVHYQNSNINLSKATISEPITDGWSIDGLTEKPIDSAFVMSVLAVALGENTLMLENKLP